MEFASKLMERTGKGYVSYSALKYAADGSRSQDMKLFELYMAGKLRKESDAFLFGSLYDCMLLEPEKVSNKFMVIDDGQIILELESSYKSPRSSKQYKTWLEEQKQVAKEDKVRVVTQEDWNTAKAMIQRLRESEVVDPNTGETRLVDYYLTGKVQHEINDWIGDVPVRGFLDCYADQNGFISDSKSTRSIHSFRYDVGTFCYDLQSYIYTQVMKTNDFYWVVQEKGSPYLCGVFKATPQTLARGEEKFWSAVKNIANWLDDPNTDSSSFAIYSEI